MCRVPQVLTVLRKQEFKLRGKSYKFDSNGDINLGYDVMMWRSDGENIHISDVVAEYDPHTNTFTHPNRSTTQQFLDLKAGSLSAAADLSKAKKKNSFKYTSSVSLLKKRIKLCRIQQKYNELNFKNTINICPKQ